MGINFSFHIRRKTKFKYNGVEYDSFDKMPEAARRVISANAPEVAAAAADADEDRELEDIQPEDGSARLQPLPEDGSAQPQPLPAELAARPPALPWGGWHAGVLIIGLLFVFFGADISYRLVKSGNYNPFFVTLGLLFLACGGGLVGQKRWARTLTLIFAPVAAFAALGLMHRASGGGMGVILLVLAACAAAFIWLLLPPVGRLFSAQRPLLPGRRLAAAAPPPRRISRALKLAVLFGNNFVLMCWFILLIVFVPLLNKLNGLLSGLSAGFTDFSAPWLALPGAFLFSVAVSVFCGWWAFRRSRMQLDQLVNWPLCHAVLKSKVKISDGDSEVYRMKFEYEVGGQKYTNISDMNFISALEDEAEEPIIYDPLKPRRSMLVDELPASIILDESGGLKNRLPFMGYFYASLPPLLLAAMAVAAFR
ncbi:MAG TPA: hypothetical protein DCS63_01210 [Elusimicrobia bacterium]|nr:hypothetical protein [Elusimicrobiota bacterium]